MGWITGLPDPLFAVRRSGTGCLRRGYEFATSVNSRITSRHLAQVIGIRKFTSNSKGPYGFTCSEISGVNARVAGFELLPPKRLR